MRWNNDDSPFLILRCLHQRSRFLMEKKIPKQSKNHSVDGIEILSANLVFLPPHDLNIGVPNVLLYANRWCLYLCLCIFCYVSSCVPVCIMCKCRTQYRLWLNSMLLITFDFTPVLCFCFGNTAKYQILWLEIVPHQSSTILCRVQ